MTEELCIKYGGLLLCAILVGVTTALIRKARRLREEPLRTEKTCSTCSQYKRPGSDHGAKFSQGGCGSSKLIATKFPADMELDDQLIYGESALVQMKAGPNFGCVHWR